MVGGRNSGIQCVSGHHYPDAISERYVGIVVPPKSVTDAELKLLDKAVYLGEPIKRKQDRNKHIANNGNYYGLDECALPEDRRVAGLIRSLIHLLTSSYLG